MNDPLPYTTSSWIEEEQEFFAPNEPYAETASSIWASTPTRASNSSVIMDRQRHMLADDEGDAEEVMGVHITYQELYHAMIFFTAIYVGGKVAHWIKMPALVGEIVVGIVLGPPLANFVPNPEAFVLLGEIGLILLVVEAGIDVDVSSLNLIGTRGVLIAVVGSFLPITLGIVLALIIQSGNDAVPINGIECLAAGATFGPTSVGVALSLLRSGGLLNTPVGQLIIAAAVIDDMIALIVLSQLENLNNEDATTNAWTILSPVISSSLFLGVGGWIALLFVPPLIQQYVHPNIPPEHIGKAELGILFAFVLALMPATHVVKASYLMGSFLAGLAFCTSHELHSEFVRQFKRILQWLLRIFFAASIGFQVPIKNFFKTEVLWKGLIFCFALTGKLAVGFMVPNFTQSPAFTDRHLRDCLLTGFSMASEGEFAFVIAVFSVGQGLISKDVYASVVLAVLISTIIPPFALRATISYYNQKAQEQLKALANAELERQHNLEELNANSTGATSTATGSGGDPATGNAVSSELALQGGGHSRHRSKDWNDGSGPGGALSVLDGSSGYPDDLTPSQRRERELMGSIVNNTAVFLCIQSHSEGRWGLMLALMSTLAKLGLEVIDHRAWHPRGIDTTLVSEIYAKDILNRSRKRNSISNFNRSQRRRSSRGGSNNSSNNAGGGGSCSNSDINVEDGFSTAQEALEFRLNEIKEALEATINQPDVARVKVQRWYPGVVEQIVEESSHGQLRRHLSLEASLLKEASQRLNYKQTVQTGATREKTVEEILAGLSEYNQGDCGPTAAAAAAGGGGEEPELWTDGSGGHDSRSGTSTAGDAPTLSVQVSNPGRRGRRKVRSSPVVGGGLFGETMIVPPPTRIGVGGGSGMVRSNTEGGRMEGYEDGSGGTTTIARNWQYRRGGPSELLPHHATPVSLATGRAEISVDNETYDVRVSTGTLKKLRGAYYQRYMGNRRSGYSRYGYFYNGLGGNSEDVVDLHIQPTTDDVTDMLHGYIRHGGHAPPLSKISELKSEEALLDLRALPENDGHFEPPPSRSSSTSSNIPGELNSKPSASPGGGGGNIIQRSLDLLHQIPHPGSPRSPSKNIAGRRKSGGGISNPLTPKMSSSRNNNGDNSGNYSPLGQQPDQQAPTPQKAQEDEEEIEFHDVNSGEDVLFEMHAPKGKEESGN